MDCISFLVRGGTKMIFSEILFFTPIKSFLRTYDVSCCERASSNYILYVMEHVCLSELVRLRKVLKGDTYILLEQNYEKQKFEFCDHSHRKTKNLTLNNITCITFFSLTFLKMSLSIFLILNYVKLPFEGKTWVH